MKWKNNSIKPLTKDQIEIKTQEKLVKNPMTKRNIIVLLLGIYVLITIIAFSIHSSVVTETSFSILVSKIRETIADNGISVIGKSSKISFFARVLIFGSFEQWIFFTTISNLFVGFMMIFFALFSSKKLQRVFFVSISYITITFIIFWTLIAPVLNFNGGFDTFISINNHFINPVFAFVAYFLLKKRILSVTNRTIYYSSIPIYGYLLFAMILFFSSISLMKSIDASLTSGANVYSFLNFFEPFFYRGGSIPLVVFLNIIIVLLAFWIPVGLGFLLKFISRLKIDRYKILTMFIKEKFLTQKDLVS
ncbi:MAGa3780 family membrane protein [[Mycoplasma] mobile]|uniref:Expressed protein n=1 Tax=Mycoplasma mobile (strain ATCC 43663 / 163K / NCTC 11711) TaxID=267748 RepID=Q6KIN0_MYCM1|nr:hypothetical protein [[Mycoplasma] mobile]AAT27546.1 expressed protein [Mycoplasma mobile 163K]